MIFASDVDGDRVYVDNALDGQKYYCPLCKEELICKYGEVRAHHFAHKSGTECRDFWHYDMSEWHSLWQSYFPQNSQEIVFSNGEERHRADVVVGDIVIEFQHSKISPEDFYRRNEFYHSIGKYIIWVFDVTGKVDYDISNIYRKIEECRIYCLKTKSPIFREKNYRESADMIFLCEDEEDGEDDFYLMQVSWWWIANGKRSAKVVFGFEDEFGNSEFVNLLLGKTQVDHDVYCGPIPRIWRKKHVKNEAILENEGGFRVRITNNPVDTYEKYGRLYGNFAAPGSNRFSRKAKQVQGMDDWKLISYK